MGDRQVEEPDIRIFTPCLPQRKQGFLFPCETEDAAIVMNEEEAMNNRGATS